MKNQIVFTYDKKHSEEVYCPPIGLDGAGTNVFTMDELSVSNRELEQLFQEVQEYDFLMGKTPQVFSDYWQEDQENAT